MSTLIRSISSGDLETLLPDLVDLLRDTVNGGVPLGFLPPLTRDEARDYWLSLRPELLAGARLLLGAFREGRLAGSGQLAFASMPNARHRAELQKLFVATWLRGGGVGRALMTALHDAALERGRSLIVLHTRRGLPAEQFYQTIGYKVVGVIPRATVGSAGERYDVVTFYQDLSS